MEWSILCDYHEAIKLTLGALGFRRIAPLSTFWERGTEWAHLTQRPDDGIKLVVNGTTKVKLAAKTL